MNVLSNYKTPLHSDITVIRLSTSPRRRSRRKEGQELVLCDGGGDGGRGRRFHGGSNRNRNKNKNTKKKKEEGNGMKKVYTRDTL